MFEMIRSIRAYPLLGGYRNMPAVNEDVIVDVLLRTSQLMAALPEVDQIDLNPVIATHKGATAVDARILLGQ